MFAFTGCPKVVTDESQEPVAECIASEVLPAFESLLEENENLRCLSLSPFQSLPLALQTIQQQENASTWQHDWILFSDSAGW